MISQIVFDSRKVVPQSVFIAQKGTLANGHDYIETAINKGATVIIHQDPRTHYADNMTYVSVEDANEALAIIGANFNDNPSEKLGLVGITGTNGKTTIATLLHQLFTKGGYRAGLLSTVKVVVGTQERPATH